MTETTDTQTTAVMVCRIKAIRVKGGWDSMGFEFMPKLIINP